MLFTIKLKSSTSIKVDGMKANNDQGILLEEYSLVNKELPVNKEPKSITRNYGSVNKK